MKFSFKSKKRLQGFSIIEVMVTLAIIAIITSVVLPNYTRLQNRAKETSLKSLAYAVQMELEGYHFDQGVYPTGSNVGFATLVKTLQKNQAFSATPINPFTGAIFKSSDTKGKMVYSKNSAGYTLKVYGAESTTILLELSNL